MRIICALVVLGGCSLYFPSDPPGDDLPGDDQPPPDGSVSTGPIDAARCEDGTLRAVHVEEYQPDQPGHGAGTVIGHCAGSCRSAAVVCTDAACTNAEDALCNAPVSQGATCDLEGYACGTAGSAIACPQTTTCGFSVEGAQCTCGADGVYHCDEQSSTAAMQAAIVGKWQGTVHPPSFSAPYPITMWIYPDGTYWAECGATSCTAFYYGGDGPWPSRKIEILSASASIGSYANIGIFFGGDPPNTGAISALTANAHDLHFTFYASWFGCGQPFQFDLTRQ